MATENGRRDSDLIGTLLERAHRFDFFQATRLLQRAQINIDGYTPADKGSRLHFRTPLSLDFPAGEVQEMRVVSEHAGDDQGNFVSYEMTVNLLGLTGPQGVLPPHYTESLIAAGLRARASNGEEKSSWLAPHEFLDIFNHRLITLYLRAWEKYRFWVHHERAEQEGLQAHLLSLLGLGSPGLQNRLGDGPEGGIPDHALAYYAGVLARKPVTAAVLSAVLSDYLEVDCHVEQMVGRWLHLPETECTQLGRANVLLGEDTTLGDRVWDRQGKFRIVLGPLRQSDLKRLLPGGSHHAGMRRLTGFIGGIGLDFDLRLLIPLPELPRCALGQGNDDSPRLGWSTWLGDTTAPPDPEVLTEVVLELNTRDTHDHQ